MHTVAGVLLHQQTLLYRAAHQRRWSCTYPGHLQRNNYTLTNIIKKNSLSKLLIYIPWFIYLGSVPHYACPILGLRSFNKQSSIYPNTFPQVDTESQQLIMNVWWPLRSFNLVALYNLQDTLLDGSARLHWNVKEENKTAELRGRWENPPVAEGNLHNVDLSLAHPSFRKVRSYIRYCIFSLLLHYSFLVNFIPGSKSVKFILRNFVELHCLDAFQVVATFDSA